MKKCSTLQDWVEQRALTYLGVRSLLEVADYLYCQAEALDDRLRLGEELTEEVVETFVQEQAKNLIKAGVGEIWVMDSLQVLIKERGYETVVNCLKAYEEEQKEKAK